MRQNEQNLRLFLLDSNFGDADFEFHFTSWLAENPTVSKGALRRFYKDAHGLAAHLRSTVRQAQLAWIKRRDFDREVQNALRKNRQLEKEFQELMRDARAAGFNV